MTDDKEKTMPGLHAAAFRPVGQDDAIPDGFVVPFYLSGSGSHVDQRRVELLRSTSGAGR